MELIILNDGLYSLVEVRSLVLIYVTY